MENTQKEKYIKGMRQPSDECADLRQISKFASLLEQEKKFADAADYWSRAQELTNNNADELYFNNRHAFCTTWGPKLIPKSKNKVH